MIQEDRQPSPDDVVAYAADLRAHALRVNNPSPSNPDHRPYARVWSPTAEYARYLTRKLGPAKALVQLQYRAELSHKQLEMHDELEQARIDKERRRRDRERVDQEELRSGMPPSERIAKALTQLQVIAQGKSPNHQGIVSGNAEHPSRILLERVGEEYTKACSAALSLARRLERTVQRLQVAPLPPQKLGDRDQQLKAMRGYSPQEVSMMDPTQGLPRQIEERREAFGLDAQTGDELPALRKAA